MKFETKESEPCVVALTVKAEAEEVQGEYKKVLNMFLREAALPGFRKGKVPMTLLKQKFQNEIKKECEQACFQEFYPKALKESALDSINLVGVEDVTFSVETGFTATALVEVKPVFDLPKYKKLTIKAGDTNVTDEQVNERVENFRKAFAKFEDAKEGDVIAEGDFVQFDYSGCLDIKDKTPLAQVVPDQKIIAGSEGFWTQLEEGRFVPEILEALKGMKVGETKNDVKVKFPKEAAPEALKGKKCVYTITVKSFRRRILLDDVEFAKSAKVDSIDVLRKQSREQLEKDAVQADLDNRKNQAIESLLKKADFGVPPSLVQRQMQSYLSELAERAQYSGLDADYFKNNQDKIIADAKANSERQVRLSYILLGIAEAEKIEVTDADINASLSRIAEGSNGRMTTEDLFKQLVETNRVELYKEQVKAEKALDLVLAEAK